MKIYKYRSLDKTFLFFVIPMVLTITGILFLFFQYSEIQEEYNDLTEFLELEVFQLSYSLSEPLWNIDYVRIGGLAEASFADPSIIGFNIFDDEGNIVLSLGSEEVKFKEEKVEISLFQVLDFILRSISSNPERIHYYESTAPIHFKTDAQKINIGSIQLIVSDEKMLEYIVRELKFFIVLSFSLSTFYLLSIYFIYKNIVTNPLIELKRSLKEAMKSDNSDGSIKDINTKNEILYIKEIFDDLWQNQKILVQEITDSEQYNQEILNSLPIGVILMDLDGKIIGINQATSEILGYYEEEILETSIWDLYTKDSRQLKLESMENLTNTSMITSLELNFIKKSGELIAVAQKDRIITRKNNEFLLSSIEDITGEKKVQKALVRSEKFLKETDEIAKIGGWEIDLLSNSLYWTEQTYKIHEVPFDYDSDLENAINFYHTSDRAVISEAVDLAINEGKAFNVEARIITAKDNELWIQAIGNVIEDKGQRISIRGTIQDITQRKNSEMKSIELEKQLNHKSKIDILGHLAGSVAHDFNNILAGVLNSAYLLSKKANLDDKLQKYIDIILQSSENGTKIANRLLTFSRKENYKKERTNVNELILDSIDILKTIVDKKIHIYYENSEVANFALIEYTSIQNALVNIGINSSHAMPSGGTITITLNTIFISSEVCEESSFDIQSGDYIEIAISDTGHGIPESIQDKIFEPFFTTKENGRGTGLGLAAVKRTIIESNGEIKINSTLNEGTTISLFLPLSDSETIQEITENEEVDHAGSGVILFVDDEEINRITAQDLLESFGYKVIIASNGQEAFDIFQNHHKSINLVILDMIMPIMDGEQTFRRIKEFSSKMPVLLCSGYSKSERITKLLKEGLDGIISKPFNITELTDTISGHLVRN